jgi:hypothetical protein
MTDRSQRIKALTRLGDWLKSVLNDTSHADREALDQVIQLAFHKNGWFTQSEVLHALHYWSEHLQSDTLEDWTKDYPPNPAEPKRVMLILAGNIPLVGMHDVVSTFISGHTALVKCSSSDAVLMPFLIKQLKTLHPDTSEALQIIDGIQKDFDAVMATGSNNSSRHFDSYFGHVPNIIRRNRTGIAILDGSETKAELINLMKDAFTYFGLGCRNVTKLYLPEGFDLDRIFEASMSVQHLIDNNKYVNNYTYHKAVMMLERQSFLENDLIVLRESSELFSPVSILHYEYYKNIADLNAHIEGNLDHIQCVLGKKHTPFGQAQLPGLKDYADGVDTLDFLVNL